MIQSPSAKSKPSLLASSALELRRLLRPQRTPSAVELARQAGIEPDPWQCDLLKSDAKQLILLCSRQSGKSLISAVLAVHEAVYHAPALILVLSPSLRQSQELFRKILSIYAAVAGTGAPPAEETSLKLGLANGSRIICLPGHEQTVRGFSGVALLLVDEAAIVSDELYMAIRPMLATSNGRMILLSTPRGRRGFFFHEWEDGGEDWYRARITAYDCPRIPRAWLERERERIGSFWFRQEFMVEFVEDEDAAFSYADVMRALDPSVEPFFAGRIFG